MTLNDIRPGQHARIRRHRAAGAVRQRLLDLGLMPDVLVELVRAAPLGDPIEVRLDTCLITLRRTEASTIDVEEQEVSAERLMAEPAAEVVRK